MNRTRINDISRRDLMAGAALLGLVGTVRAQYPQVDAELAPNPQELARVIAAFLNGATPATEGIALELPPIGDNPAQVPLRAHVTLPLQNGLYCPGDDHPGRSRTPIRWPAGRALPRRWGWPISARGCG
ncbi:hypothetical protein PE067_15800 [Paracoccus sp. DMF-8]|uniref:hypothetical protein n=1 Tax=Paracoccus sp. DMF-8 TaxID=3019445 RepID=UPI0023E3AFF7|nr:hypothetical protein [Paracoccus sp. DMF-8]MDF3607472.1 hypothetical protein [Paracoccus sp. DMF-8]